MKISFLFGGPGGERSIDEEELALPYRVGNFKEHPFLTLGDYFRAAASALLEEDTQPLLVCLEALSGVSFTRKDLEKVVVRSEKHGAVYHVASIDIHAEGRKIRLGLNGALSSSGAAQLENEYQTLELLSSRINPSLIPMPLRKTKVTVGKKGEYFLFALVRWFDDYHEWHLTGTDWRNEDIVTLWDTTTGYRRASSEEVYDIFRLSSKILTLYYDVFSFSQIRPWHHAAGDFVVRIRNGITDIRLVSARGYSPSPLFQLSARPSPIVALVYFLIEISVRMRIDRFDGTGSSAWAGKVGCYGTVDGFLEGIKELEANDRLEGIQLTDIVSLLNSFEIKEFLNLLEPVADMISIENPEDYNLLAARIEDHAHDLYEAVRACRP